MTTRSIIKQVETIRNATKNASSSKNAARAFLMHAGIINTLKSAKVETGKTSPTEKTKTSKIAKVSKKKRSQSVQQLITSMLAADLTEKATVKRSGTKTVTAGKVRSAKKTNTSK